MCELAINPAFAQASKLFDSNRPSAVILLHYTGKLFFSKFFASTESEFPKIYPRLPKIAEDFGNLPKIVEDVRQLPKIAENFGRLPKIAEDVRQLPRIAENFATTSEDNRS